MVGPRITRRQFFAGALLAGCGGSFGENGTADGPDEFLGTVPFTDDQGALEVATGEGLDGRLYTDLSKLRADALVTSNDAHYIRTRYPDLLDPNAPWKIAVSGLVEAPFDLTLEALAPMVKKNLGPYVLECSGNGSFAGFGMLSAARWSGILMSDVLAAASYGPGFSSHCTNHRLVTDAMCRTSSFTGLRYALTGAVLLHAAAGLLYWKSSHFIEAEVLPRR